MAKRRRRKNETGLPTELLDELLKNYKSPEDLTGPDGLLKQLTKALVTRAMDAELTHHLGYEAGEKPPEGQANRRNGTSPKTLRTDQGKILVDVPRDREGSFEPQIVPKHQRHFAGFDDKIISMYARGMSVREIRSHLEEIYGVDVSADLISTVTDSVIEELRQWQDRPLQSLYPIVYLDALVAKVRDQGMVQNKSIYMAVGVDVDGAKEVLGLWVQSTEGAKFWMAILSELKARGVEDALVLCADGLTGMAQAVEAVFPKTIFQTCVVHMIRASTRFVPWKERRAVCADLRPIYTAPNVEAAEAALEAFEEKWGKRFPMIGPIWRRRWDEVTPFLSFPEEIRHAIYTTNSVEAMNRQVRKVLKTRGALPSDQAVLKLVYLALRNARSRWSRTKGWAQARLQFQILFGDRFPA